MNDKPNLPEEIMFGPSYSLRANLKANTWAFVAMLLSWAGDQLLSLPRDWNVAQRAIIALVPLLIGLLWVRDFVRWVRGMDEMHRRLSVEACGFAFPHRQFPDFAGSGLLLSRLRHLQPPLQMKNKLRELRAAKEWSQSDLAEKLSVSRQTVNAIETEKYDPSLPLAFKVARLFKLPIEDIFELDQD
jgi:putative transcriptional regulator